MLRPIAELLIAPVDLPLGGRKWRLIITYGALLECEAETGIDMLHTVDVLNNPTAQTLRVLVCELLRRSDPGLSPRAVGAMIGPRDLAAIEIAIVRAYAASMPEPEKRQPKRGKEAGPPQTWIELRGAAREELRLSDEEWRAMSPREFHSLRAAHIRIVHDQEYMTAQLIAATINYGMGRPKQPVKPSAFLLHRIPEDEPAADGEVHINEKTGAFSFRAA